MAVTDFQILCCIHGSKDIQKVDNYIITIIINYIITIILLIIKLYNSNNGNNNWDGAPLSRLNGDNYIIMIIIMYQYDLP